MGFLANNENMVRVYMLSPFSFNNFDYEKFETYLVTEKLANVMIENKVAKFRSNRNNEKIFRNKMLKVHYE